VSRRPLRAERIVQGSPQASSAARSGGGLGAVPLGAALALAALALPASALDRGGKGTWMAVRRRASQAPACFVALPSRLPACDFGAACSHRAMLQEAWQRPRVAKRLLSLGMQQPRDKVGATGSASDSIADTRSTATPNRPEAPNHVPMASWLMVAVLLLANIHQQWTRALVFYIVSFKVPATEETARLYMNIDLGFGEEQYALLASFGFTILFTVCSLLAGRAADSGNRAGITAVAAVGWSVATVAQGLASSFEYVLGARALTGLSQAFSNPAAYGLIASTFPESRVSTANSIYSSAVYVGGALASLTILLDNQIGWRDSSIGIGVLGLVLAGVSAVFLKDPEERPGLFDGKGGQVAAPGQARSDQIEDTEGSPSRQASVASQLSAAAGAAQQVLSIPFVQLLFAATAFRFAAGYGLGVWKAPFFREAFPASQAEFSVANAVVISGGGVLSSLAGGALADRFSPSNPRVRLWIPAAGSLLAVPFWLGTCYSDSFEASIALLFGEYIVAECWFGPTLASLYRAVPKEVQGTAQGLFSVLTAFGNLMPVVIGSLQKDHPLPDVLAGTISLAYITSGLFFFAASSQMPTNTSDRADDSASE